MSKMTDEQIINALKKYIECAESTQIARDVGGTLVISLLQNALDLINRQQAQLDDLKRDTIPKLQDSLKRANKYGLETDKENEKLKAEIEKLSVELVGMRGACNSYKMHYDNAKAEIERLQKKPIFVDTKIYDMQVEVSKKIEKEIKSEAIKEFADRLKAKEMTFKGYNGFFFKYIPIREFDNLVKEMVGEGK